MKITRSELNFILAQRRQAAGLSPEEQKARARDLARERANDKRDRGGRDMPAPDRKVLRDKGEGGGDTPQKQKSAGTDLARAEDILDNWRDILPVPLPQELVQAVLDHAPESEGLYEDEF